jgi:hypothetical protein
MPLIEDSKLTYARNSALNYALSYVGHSHDITPEEVVATAQKFYVFLTAPFIPAPVEISAKPAKRKKKH